LTIQIPVSLKDKIFQQQIIPIVAAGVSMSLKDKKGEQVFPSWPKLLNRAADKLKDEGKEDEQNLVAIMVKKNRLQEAAKEAKDGLSGSLWNGFLSEQFSVDFTQMDEASKALPEAIWQLNNKLITLNYDKTLLWAHPEQTSVCSFDNSNATQLNQFSKVEQHKNMLWHIHGHIDNPEHMVLTPESYHRLYQENAESHYKIALQKLKELVSTKCLLFIGCSMSDIELITEINKQSDLFANNTGPHYVLVHESQKDDIEQKLNANKNLFEIIAFSDFGEPLLEAIKQLADCRNKLAGSVTEYIQTKEQTVEQNEELDNQPNFDKITVLVSSPLDRAIDDTIIMGKLKRYKYSIFEQALTEQNLLNSEDYSIFILIAKHTNNGLMIEDDNACRDYLTIGELEDYLPINKKLVILITDKPLADLEIAKVSFPILVLTLLNKQGKELKILDKLPHQLFKKSDISVFINKENIQLKKLTDTLLMQLTLETINSPIWLKVSAKLPPSINPSDLNGFTGRRYDLTAISQQLTRAASYQKLLTIKGSGGLGKTTIAKKIALELAIRGHFKGGVSFVNCEHLSSAKQLEMHISSAFNLQASDDLINHLAEHHDGKTRLIILDNLESLLYLKDNLVSTQAALAKQEVEQIKTLLSHAVRFASILVTSRESINCDWEEVYPFRAMESNEALALFNQFTSSVYSSAQDQEYLRRKILEPMLDNNPLAIKLICGGLAPGKNLEVLRQELEEDFFNKVKESDLGLMFDNDADGNINRQESLYVSILYSYNTLNEGQKRAFECMSLFPDGINLDSFQRLVNETKSKLRSNQSKSPTLIAKQLVSDKDIKVLKDKSLLDVQGKNIKLQSIINRFARQQFEQYTEVNNQVSLYKDALIFNQQLLIFIDKLDGSGDKRALVIFVNNIQNLLAAASYAPKNSVLKNKDEINEYIDFLYNLNRIALGVNLCTELVTLIDNIETSHSCFVEGLNEQTLLAWQLIRISAAYYSGDFEDAFKELQRTFSLEQFLALSVDSDMNWLIRGIARDLYVMEGFTIECLKCSIELETHFTNSTPSLFAMIGFDIAELLPCVIPDLFYFEAQITLPNGLNYIHLQQTLKKLHESEHLERVQLTYIRARFQPLTISEVDKLVSVNPYTRGLKQLMYAFVNEQIFKEQELNNKHTEKDVREEQIQLIRDYYQKALPLLRHIKFYYTQAHYYYARFLQLVEHNDYQTLYVKGLNLSQKHCYRYLQHQFLIMENSKLGTYLPEDYPLPDNLDVRPIIQKQIKWINQNFGSLNPFYQ
jgi:hypothetical protein